MVSDVEREKVLVADLLLFKERLDKVLAIAFQGSDAFTHALKESFETFINVRQVNSVAQQEERGRKVRERERRGGRMGTEAGREGRERCAIA